MVFQAHASSFKQTAHSLTAVLKWSHVYTVRTLEDITLHSWFRGVFFVVSAGGHIEYWQPIYRFASLKNYVYCLHRWIAAICLVAGGVKG